MAIWAGVQGGRVQDQFAYRPVPGQVTPPDRAPISMGPARVAVFSDPVSVVPSTVNVLPVPTNTAAKTWATVVE